MKKVLAVTMALVFAASGQAGITTTGNVEPGDPATWTSSDNAYVGKTADGSLAVNGGDDVVCELGYIARDETVSGSVTITGAGSTWTNDYLTIGDYGEGELNITSGGLVTSNYGASMGANDIGIGTVTVTGPGSQWITDIEGWNWLYVGDYGTGTLNISNGGIVSSATSVIGNDTGSGTATVTGSGSQWVNTSELVVGFGGTGTLTIANGGVVSNTTGSIGQASGTTGTATVTGTGSTWTNSLALHVGLGGTGTLNITDGGSVSNTYGYIGYNSASNGTVTVDGPGSTWTNSSELYVGASGTAALNITGGGAVNSSYGGIGFNSGSTGIATINNGTWTNSEALWVGYNGNGTLTIENGGTVSNTYGDIGRYAGSASTATVDGAGSTWTNSSGLYVGRFGTGTLNITNGGVVTNTDGFIGQAAGSDGTATVNGTGSQWANSGSLSVGSYGDGTLDITGGGSVSDTFGYIGFFADSTGTVTVTGTDSTWTNSNQLRVGHQGNGTLNISNGGAVSNTNDGNIGYDTGSTGAVTVDNGTWTNGGNLYVGRSGTGTLNITGGGVVSNAAGYTGRETGSTGTATVTGAGSQWNNSAALHVGEFGTGMLEITGGGSVTNTDGYIGYSADSDGTATVDGTGSTWTNSGSLYVGREGSGTLTISNGGVVSNTLGYVGGINASTGTATATVTGAGSTWANSGYLYVGRDGGASLTVADGGAVSSMAGSIATEIGTTGTVTVTGTDSQWTMSDLIFVGCGMTDGELVARGAGTLNISDGGEVIVPYGIIGSTSTLSGDGTLTLDSGSGTLGNHGTIAPGNSIGTLTVDGDVVFENGSTLEAEIDNAGNCDKLNVTGDVTINSGSTLAVNSNGETIEAEKQYTLIEADGSITGEFTTVDTALVTWDTDVEQSMAYDGSTAALVVTADSVLPFDDMSLLYTDNQRACGNAIQQISDASGDLGGIPAALQGIVGDDNLRHAYDQLSGQTRPSIAPIVDAGVSGFTGAVSGRLQSARQANLGTSGALLAMADSPAGAFGPSSYAPVSDVGAIGRGGPYDAGSKYGAWTKGFGAIGDRDSEGGVNGYDYEIGGVAAGLDYQFTENFMAGVTLGYADTDVEYRSSRDNSRIDSLYGGLYGSYMDSDGYIEGIFAYADLDSETDQYVDFVTEKNEGSFDGYEISGYVEVARNYYFKDILVQPLGGFEFGYQRQDSYTEEGGDSAHHYGQQTFESYKSSLGAKASKYLFQKGRQSLWAQLRAKWVHEFGDAAAGVTASFASAPGYRFSIKDAKMNRDSAVLGTGLKYGANRHTVLFADYDVLLNGDAVAQVFSAGFRYMW